MAKILVIDDDPDIRDLLLTYLKDKGHLVFAAEDGAHGIGMVAQRQPDMVILDVDMPVLDGHSTMRVLKGDPQMAGIPVIVLTAHVNDDTQQTMRRAGCAGFLSKPLDFDQLDRAVKHSLEVRQA
ncbi:MAG: response regulator [Magnetovibrio sp.]|nr:response regulator [Magnetovibrio sp.]